MGRRRHEVKRRNLTKGEPSREKKKRHENSIEYHTKRAGKAITMVSGLGFQSTERAYPLSPLSVTDEREQPKLYFDEATTAFLLGLREKRLMESGVRCT